MNVKMDFLNNEKELAIIEFMENDLQCHGTNEYHSLTMEDKLKLRSLFLCEKSSDMIFKTSDEEEVPVHKAILATVSPIFREIFIHNKNATKIELINTPHHILIKILTHVYLDEIDTNSIEIIFELLASNEFYQIDNLKIKCANILLGLLNEENVMLVLKAANDYELTHLQIPVKKFLLMHMKLFLESNQTDERHDPEKLKRLRGYVRLWSAQLSL